MSQEQKEQQKKQAKINKLERMMIPCEYAGQYIYVAKKFYDSITKVTVTDMWASGGKLTVRYQTKAGGNGTLELYDIGPAPL